VLHLSSTAKFTKKLSMLVGAHSLIQQTGTQRLHISTVIKHKKYVKSTFQNDVALLKVKKKRVFSNVVKPLCLLDGDVPAGMQCIVAGWGETQCK